MKRLSILLAAGLTLGLMSCEKKYDTPPIKEIPEGTIKTIAELRAMYTGADSTFSDDLTIRCVVTTDQTSGNFYKEAYIKDNTGAIKLRFTGSTSLSIGDSIRVQLNGGRLTQYKAMLSVDDLDPDGSTVILKNNVDVTPTIVTLDQVTGAMQGQLIQIDNVEFSDADLGTTWADAINKFSANHNLTDCNGSAPLLVRTSGYANFAGEVIPNGNGSMIGVVGVYNADIQLLIRNPNELTMSGVRCAGGGGGASCDPLAGLNETFAGNTAGTTITENCWKVGTIQGSNNWICGDNSGNQCATATGNASGTQEMWMSTPLIQSNGSDVLTFSSAKQNMTTSTLNVYVSTNYDGTNYNSATWTALSATLVISSDSDNTYISSGNVNLSSALGAGYTGTYAVAFKANMENNEFSLFKIDNVVIAQ